MDNITITILCSVVSAAVAWFSAINTVKKNTAEEAKEMATLKTLIEQQSKMLESIDEKLEKSVDDRKDIHKKLSAIKEQIITLFKNDDSIAKRLESLEEKCRQQYGGGN